MKYSYSVRRYSILLCLLSVAVVTLNAAPPVNDFQQRIYPRVKWDKNKRYSPSLQRRVGKINLAPRGLLILANFTDTVFQEHNTIEAFDSLANSDNYTYNGAYGSAREYFLYQSNGQYVPDFDVIGPVNLPNTMAYYGTNDGRKLDRYTADFVMDAVEAACNAGADLSNYDTDGDGIVDFVYILYAGYGEQDTKNTEAIWAHNWELSSSLHYQCTNQKTYYFNSDDDFNMPKYQGYYIDSYACSNELRRTGDRCGIGVFSHEFGHVLGLPDYYPTDDNTPVKTYQTPGAWSTMGYACYTANGNVPCNYSVYDKYFLGWIKPQLLTIDTHFMPADNSVFYMLTRDMNEPVKGAFTEDTIYYFENRQYKDWDAYLPGHGLLIWQVIYNNTDWNENKPNNNIVRYNIISADGSSPYTQSNWGHDKEGCPFPGTQNIQSIKLFNYNIKNIVEDADGNISFTVADTSVPTDGAQAQQSESQAKKILKNGQFIIMKGDNKYTVTGQKL